MQTPTQTERPWLSAYPEGVSADLPESPYTSLVGLMEESFKAHAARPAYSFMGRSSTSSRSTRTAGPSARICNSSAWSRATVSR